MLADLDLLLTAVFCTADDLLLERTKNARRSVLLDSTPLEGGRSVETARGSQLADACGYGYDCSHSRSFWGMRLHLLAAPDGTPRAAILAPADQTEREVALRLLPLGLHGGESIVADKGYTGRDFAAAVSAPFSGQFRRPVRRRTGARTPPRTDPPMHESIFWTLKERLGLERHHVRTLHGIRARITAKLLALAAGVWFNHTPGAAPAEPFDLAV